MSTAAGGGPIPPVVSATSPAPTASWSTAMRLAFLAGDLGHAVRIAEDATRELDPCLVLDEVVAPALRDVGLLWERDMISVADEHLATATAHRLLAAVAPRLRRAPADSRGELAILATPPSERHTTGLLMVEDVLRGAGFRVKNFGGGVPLAAVRGFVARERPALVGFSATMSRPEELLAAVDTVRDACTARVLVGGAEVPDTPLLHAERVIDLRALAATLSL